MIDWNKNLATTVQHTKQSGIRRFFDIASTMEDVISLGIGEPDFVHLGLSAKAVSMA